MEVTTIPWIEKYRPSEFNDIILDPHNRLIMEQMLESNDIPNMLFYGPPGTGKTTTIINIINNYQKKYNQCHKELVIHLNASDDRGIEIIRSKISSFTNSSYLFNKGVKFIVLDEIDYMTKSAQFALGKLIKENHKDVRFCLISNYISKIDKVLQNICMPFKFNTLPKDKIREFLQKILDSENIVQLSNENINELINIYNSDVRSMINYLQGFSQSSEKKFKIITAKDISNILQVFKTKPVEISEKYFLKTLINFNIEKHELVIKILEYITKQYDLSCDTINFIRTILKTKKNHTSDFNIFFISYLSTIMGDKD